MSELDSGTSKIQWRKATASSNGAGCVELADLGVVLRDSRNPEGPRLHYTRSEVAAFIDGVRQGEFDYLIDQAG